MIAGIDRDVAFAAAGRDDHVHAAEDFPVAFDAGGIQRQPGGIGADALPRFHLTLVALLGDLRVEGDRRQRMDDVGRETLLVDIDALGIERIPMRLQPFAERGHDADTGDPDFLPAQPWVIACSGKPILLAIASMCTRKSGSGKGIWRKVRSALHFSSVPTRDLRRGDGKARAFMLDLGIDRQQLAGTDETAHLGFLHHRQERHALELHHAEQKPAGTLRHRFGQQDAGHDRDSPGNAPRRSCASWEPAPRP